MDIFSSSTPGELTRCDECDKKFKVVMEIGEEFDYESATAWICLDCLKEAVRRLERFMEKQGAN